jgi:hypothetical protein
MLEVAQEVLAYLLEKPVLYAIMGCLAGFAGNKTVAYE